MMLLRRATQCFCRRHRYPHELWYHVKIFYYVSEHSWRYNHLLTATFRRSPPPSYDFPDHINLMTLYMMSMFPYGYKFDKDRLVRKWIRESSCNERGDREEQSDRDSRYYFSRLVDQNVITHAAANSRSNNLDEAEAWQFNVNHLVHQFLASKSAEMGFVFTSATLNLAAASVTDNGNETSRIPRRLALHCDDPNIPSLLQTIDLSQIRSLAVSGAVSRVALDKFVNLVVLDVEGWENFEDDDLLWVCRSKMFFLGYLSIRKTKVSKLPPEINELCNLEILDASYTQVTELPLGVFLATRLHRLDLRGTMIRQLMPKQILELDSLHGLLLGDEGMMNSAETATRVPHDIRRLSSLDTLATIDLSEHPASFINALGDLENLQVLAVTWSFHQSSDRDYREALLASIKRWSKLESLTIHCGLGCSMEFLGSLSEVHFPLRTFKVAVGRFAHVPQWFHGLSRLSSVQITVCKLGAHDLEKLGNLPELQCLILGLDVIPEEAIVIKGFCFLRRFSIHCPVPWLTFESGAMPKLTYLQLSFCSCSMSQIRVPLGISNLPSLKEVALWYNVRYANSSSVKMTVEAMRKEVAKCRNATQMISLFINGIEQDDVQAVNVETENANGAPSGTNAGGKYAVQAVDEITEA